MRESRWRTVSASCRSEYGGLERNAINRTGEPAERRLLWLTLRQPLLTTTLRFAFLGFLPDARLLVKPPALQFPEEAFPRELLFGNFEGFFNVIIEDFDFHSSRLFTFPGDACTGFFLVRTRP